MTTVQISSVKEYLLDNKDELRQIVSELNSWNGCLDHLEIYENDEYFFETFFSGQNPMEAVRAAHFGDYNFGDDYVRFNAYGNLESFNDYTYEKELEDSIDDIIDNILSEEAHIDISDELYELLNPEEEEEEEEEEE